MIRNIFILTASVLLVTEATGQTGDKTAELNIKSSVVCGMCKERVEAELIFEKGVKEVTVDLAKKEVKVEYNANKTTPEQIRTALSTIGYDADDVAADPKAYKKLPACCKKDAPSH